MPVTGYIPMKEKIEKSVSIRNKKALHEYHFIDTYVAGMVLRGTEIKSIRQSKVNMQDAFCVIKDDEIWVANMHISIYTEGTHYNHQPKSDRKLLMKKREIEKLRRGLDEKGLTVIPIKLFINDRGLAKLEIALAKGKKLHDKRDDIKERDIKREMQRERY
jgi:SsrA-binding protein